MYSHDLFCGQAIFDVSYVKNDSNSLKIIFINKWNQQHGDKSCVNNTSKHEELSRGRDTGTYHALWCTIIYHLKPIVTYDTYIYICVFFPNLICSYFQRQKYIYSIHFKMEIHIYDHKLSYMVQWMYLEFQTLRKSTSW